MECSNWMRCYTDGQYNRNSTKRACERAGLVFNGNACWAKKFHLTALKSHDNCNDIASRFCPRYCKNVDNSYKCLKE
ncbi:hypothetical protein DSO57_1011918 [Entomophthora muscae]|uniref:Uncharacterized protein n=1 Tax=Entomophthora muscae TaxID=34485 RepID=A0ACC2T677_9FUNG|nr:hypothetical protein DSO57_1011918 [Entomophthora muscae]